MKIENEKLGVSFSLPKKLNVRQQLGIKSRMVLMYDINDYYMIFWQAVLPIIEDWQCDRIPSPADIDMNNETDPQVTDIIVWVCSRVNTWLQDLEGVEKKR